MKKISLLAALLSAMSYQVQAQQFSNAVDYLNFFNQEFHSIQQLQLNYMSLAVYAEEAEANQAQQKLQAAINGALSKFEQVQPFAKDNGLKQNALQTMTEMKQLSESNYADLVAKKVSCTNCFDAELYESELIKKDGKELDKAMNRMSASMDAFAKANNIKLLSSKDQDDLTISKFNKITDYLRELNLVVLQLQYANDKIIAAFNNNDINLGRKEAKNLQNAVREAQTRFNRIARITEDSDCIAKVSALLNHYQLCVDKYYPAMLGAFDKNGKIINEKVDDFNQNIPKVTDLSNEKLNAYQMARVGLLQKHTPRPQQKIFKS